MDLNEIDEVLAVFEGYREKFPYARDAFALTRILDETGEGKDISAIRKGPNGRFLNLPLVRDFIARAGGGKLTPDLFLYYAPQPTDLYMVTLDRWGSERKYWGRGWQQMARPGFNLVVQLNLSGKHMDKIRKVDPVLLERVTDRWSDHPVRDDGQITVAWSRVDMDVSAGVALIEEIQSDWVRETRELRDEVRAITRRQDFERAAFTRNRHQPRRSWLKYLDGDDFRRIEKHWAEAMLEATCQFLREEIGITEIYLYDYETGCRIKGMNDPCWQPPRSLYTNLPKRFGMKRVETVPAFLKAGTDRHLKKVLKGASARFWYLPCQDGEADDSPPGYGPGSEMSAKRNERGGNSPPPSAFDWKVCVVLMPTLNHGRLS